MKPNNDSRFFNLSFWMKISNFPTIFTKKLMSELFKLDYYELEENNIIVHHNRFSKEIIPVSTIKAWSLFPEMGFDFVKIELLTGENLVLVDKRNDLIMILDLLAKNIKIDN